MTDPRFFNEFSERIMGLLPPGVGELREDFEKNLRATLQSAFARMDLVTREEFDVQAAVLHRTREQLEALEQRIAALEQAQSAGATQQTRTRARKKTARE